MLLLLKRIAEACTLILDNLSLILTSLSKDLSSLVTSSKKIEDKIDKVDTKLDEIIKLLTVDYTPTAVSFILRVENLDGSDYVIFDEGESMDVIVGSQKRVVVEGAVDKFGNPAPFEGIPSYSSGGDAISSIEPAEDGMSAVITFGTASGVSGQVTVTADGKIGPDEALFHGTADFTTIADVAASFRLSVVDVPPATEV